MKNDIEEMAIKGFIEGDMDAFRWFILRRKDELTEDERHREKLEEILEEVEERLRQKYGKD